MSDPSTTQPIRIKPSGTWRFSPADVERINFIAAREAKVELRLKHDSTDFIADVIRALDMWEKAAEQGIPRLHAMEMVLLQDRENR